MLDTSDVLTQVSSAQVSSVQWLDRVDGSTIPEVHRVVSAVVELGGAVGWLQVPIPEAMATATGTARTTGHADEWSVMT